MLKKKILAGLLCMVLLLGYTPITTAAETECVIIIEPFGPWIPVQPRNYRQ